MTGNGRELGGSFALGPWRVRRAGYGAMQLAGDGGLRAAAGSRVNPKLAGRRRRRSCVTLRDLIEVRRLRPECGSPGSGDNRSP